MKKINHFCNTLSILYR
uniref:Uncharacterized protein n=1 Tax=Rhizophora mucronata TaxID=61149 RepID=A0A2P2JMD0_RHIMU